MRTPDGCSGSYRTVTRPSAIAGGFSPLAGAGDELRAGCPPELPGTRGSQILGGIQGDRDCFTPGRLAPGNAPNTRWVVQGHGPCGHHTRVHRPCEHPYDTASVAWRQGGHSPRIHRRGSSDPRTVARAAPWGAQMPTHEAWRSTGGQPLRRGAGCVRPSSPIAFRSLRRSEPTPHTYSPAVA
jgi:hypothetical protein